MKHVRDAMDTDVVEVGPDEDVHALARKLAAAGRDGAVVIEDGRLVGVVTSMDLVFQEKKLHLPTVIQILDAAIPLGWLKSKKELEKIVGTTVGAVMTADPVTAAPDDELAGVATQMVDQHLSLVPVVERGPPC